MAQDSDGVNFCNWLQTHEITGFGGPSIMADVALCLEFRARSVRGWRGFGNRPPAARQSGGAQARGGRLSPPISSRFERLRCSRSLGEPMDASR